MSDEKDIIKIELSNNIIMSVAKVFLPEIREYYSNNNSSLISDEEEIDDDESKVKPSA
ncbi:MAG: hypothetical protein IKH90_10005 [Ruminococcus sp.]|nr:hypothetical protein [Ruminococcus sp.]